MKTVLLYLLTATFLFFAPITGLLIAGGVLIGNTYIETSTGYFKKRLI